MRPWARFLVCGLAGVAAGAGAAVWNVRSGAWGSAAKIGPWTTGTDFGTAEAGAYTRAVVALRGLLALPRRDARYYNAAVDDGGRPLDGRCRYRVSGGETGGSWWSLTLYDRDGYLVPNEDGIWSVPGAAMSPAERDSWSVMVAPHSQPGHWLPTGNRRRFELTLRVYLPADGGAGNLPRERLPHIDRLGCP